MMKITVDGCDYNVIESAFNDYFSVFDSNNHEIVCCEKDVTGDYYDFQYLDDPNECGQIHVNHFNGVKNVAEWLIATCPCNG